MKKLLLIPIFFLLIGCTNQDDFFAKKQECAKYLPQVEQEIDEIQTFTGNSATKPEVFYSPKLDTCISTWTLDNDDDTFRAFQINDLFTNERIYFKGYTGKQIEELNNQLLTGFEEFGAKIEELKKK